MHECPCCGDDYIYSDDPDELCRDCKQAGCEPNDDEDSDNFGIYESCEVKAFACPDCDTPPSFMNDNKWHDNCDDDCPRVEKEGHVAWT